MSFFVARLEHAARRIPGLLGDVVCNTLELRALVLDAARVPCRGLHALLAQRVAGHRDWPDMLADAEAGEEVTEPYDDDPMYEAAGHRVEMDAFRSGGQTYETGPRPTLTTPSPVPTCENCLHSRAAHGPSGCHVHVTGFGGTYRCPCPHRTAS